MTTVELKSQVEANQNVLSVRMEVLRDMVNAKRLGVHVCDEISRTLAHEGLGHFPSELETDGWAEARIYRLGTPVAELISATSRPGETGDAILREQAESSATETLDRIRALVCFGRGVS
jgi:hypothetical protein